MCRRWLRAAVLLAMYATLWAASASATETLRLQLYWVHQAQFAGYYLAKTHGSYRQGGHTGKKHLQCLCAPSLCSPGWFALCRLA
jgi:ABC-type nitrate/sulfonate/bicarbonate transport system substrate-binding protein